MSYHASIPDSNFLPITGCRLGNVVGRCLLHTGLHGSAASGQNWHGGRYEFKTDNHKMEGTRMKYSENSLTLTLAEVQHSYRKLYGKQVPFRMPYSAALQDMVLDFGKDRVIEVARDFNFEDYVNQTA
jgi:hypothetical protein